MVIENLPIDLKVVLEWFGNNKMTANPRQFQLMLLGKHKPLNIEIEGFKVESVKSVKFLRLTIYHNLTFGTQVSNICQTAGAKITRLSRIRNALDAFCHSLINFL